MTQKQSLVRWFLERGGSATLGDILRCGEPFSYEFRARMTDLRKEGFVITMERGKTPSENRYCLYPPEKSGQLVMGL